MGVISFFRKVFAGEEEDPALREARARHNIVVEEEKKDKAERDEKEPYDPWEEVDNMRRTFFLGSWANRKLRWKPTDDKLKEELDELERKREEKRKAKQQEEEGKRGEFKE